MLCSVQCSECRCLSLKAGCGVPTRHVVVRQREPGFVNVHAVEPLRQVLKRKGAEALSGRGRRRQREASKRGWGECSEKDEETGKEQSRGTCTWIPALTETSTLASRSYLCLWRSCLRSLCPGGAACSPSSLVAEYLRRWTLQSQRGATVRVLAYKVGHANDEWAFAGVPRDPRERAKWPVQ